jgi:hypothetical protein
MAERGPLPLVNNCANKYDYKWIVSIKAVKRNKNIDEVRLFIIVIAMSFFILQDNESPT